MPLKQDRTSFNVSQNLKTALQAKGFQTGLVEGQTFYDGSGSEIHLALFALADGKFRTVANTSTFTDIVEPNDTNFVRMLIEEELAILIGRTPGVNGFNMSFAGNTRTCDINFNATVQSGSDTKKVDAMAKALIKCINLL